MRIRTPSRRVEKRLLAAMLALMNEPPDNRFLSRARREVFAVVIGLLLVAVALAALRTGLVLAWVTTGSALLLGLVIGIGARRILALEEWPIISRCLDRGKIEARLRELDA